MTQDRSQLKSGDITLMSLASGVSVANIYYLQPILRPLASSLGVSAGTAGLLPTITMVGYALGLLFIVPTADRLGPRRLSLWLSTARLAALIGCAFAPSFAVFAVTSVVLGLSSILAQVLMPVAVTLSGPGSTGRVTGRITAGLFGGIVGARVLSGFVADALGWRSVYLISAVLTALLAVALRNMPEPANRQRLPYRRLIASLAPLVREEGALRHAVAVAAAGFGAFNLFWTAVALYVTGAPHHWPPAAAGSLGLVGLTGTVTALVVGRYLDRGWYRGLTVSAAAIMTGALLVSGAGGDSGVLLVAAAMLLDSGARISNVANQAHALSRRPEARARLNTVYMAGYFAAGSIGSALGALVFTGAGWPDTSLLAAAITAASGLLALRRAGSTKRRDTPSARAVAEPVE